MPMPPGRRVSSNRRLGRLARAASLLLLLCLATGCGKKKAGSGKSPPAKVEKHPTETDIYRLTLTPKAVERLAISTDKVRKTLVRRHRTFGGEVMVPPGSSVIVTAPVAGTLQVPPKGKTARPGEDVEAGRTMFTFVPLLTPERYVPTPAERVAMANARASLLSAQIIAAGDVNQAEAEVKAAQIVLERVTQLFADKAGSRKDVDDAKAALSIAQKKRDAAAARKKTLDELTLNMKAGKVQPFDITAPEHGTLRSLSVTKGQTVTPGTALFEIVKLDTVWIRVPVYVEQVGEIPRQSFGEITGLGRAVKTFTLPIHRIAAVNSRADSLGSDRLQRLTTEITRHGQRRPVPVRWDEKSGKWRIHDDHSETDANLTLLACRAAGVQRVRCQVFASPVTAPPTANPLATTVDLYFEVRNPPRADRGSPRWFRPGERVGVTVPIDGKEQHLVMKAGAILHDVNGTAWVYERTSRTTFRRQRVLVRFVSGDLAVLESGPPVGTDVVVDGAAELYGTEFGAGK